MADPTTDQRLQYVRVTNNLPFDFVDRYDGVPVTIPSGKSENLPPDMAFHFFGYTPGADRKTMLKHVSKRHGWNTSEFVVRNPATLKTKAEEWMDLLDIKAVMYKLVPAEESDPQKPVPADAQFEDDEPTGGIVAPRPKMTPKRVEVNL